MSLTTVLLGLTSRLVGFGAVATAVLAVEETLYT
jgi:hypothetical protein